MNEQVWCRVFWNVLAGSRRLRQCRFGGCFPKCWHRVAWCITGIWLNRSYDGLRHRAHIRLSPESSSVVWSLGGRFPAKELLPYIVAQVLGGLAAGGVLYLIASSKAGFDLSAGFAANGYGAHSPGGYSLLAALITEVVMTMMFLLVILGATDNRAPQGFAPIAIGLCLTLIHLISIPVTNTSVNPARSTGVAVFVGGWAVSQLWLFWVAPIIGGILGATIYRFIGNEKQ